jgi:hypothetical protein
MLKAALCLWLKPEDDQWSLGDFALGERSIDVD